MSTSRSASAADPLGWRRSAWASLLAWGDTGPASLDVELSIRGSGPARLVVEDHDDQLGMHFAGE